MKHFKTISEYCKAIGISPPRHPHFDIRSFEENMGEAVSGMPPFRHNFFHHIGQPDVSVMAVYVEDGACGTEMYGNIFYKAGIKSVMKKCGIIQCRN